jgi:hypothetical protein
VAQLSNFHHRRGLITAMADMNPYVAPTATINAASTAEALPGMAACPKCQGPAAARVKFTWWGGALGPKLFNVVRCGGCQTQYNGKTGGKLTKTIAVYQVVALAFFGTLTYLFVTNYLP